MLMFFGHKYQINILWKLSIFSPMLRRSEAKLMKNIIFRIWDVYLMPPGGKSRRIRSTVELMKYVQENPTVPIDGRSVQFCVQD